jgi:hypothetical protein
MSNWHDRVLQGEFAGYTSPAISEARLPRVTSELKPSTSATFFVTSVVPLAGYFFASGLVHQAACTVPACLFILDRSICRLSLTAHVVCVMRRQHRHPACSVIVCVEERLQSLSQEHDRP